MSITNSEQIYTNTQTIAGRGKRRFAPFQMLAAIICGFVFLAVTTGLVNVLIGRAAAPARLHDVLIAVHLALLMVTLALTVTQLVLPKGTRLHRKLGYAWCASLLAGVLVSFGIHEIGGFSIPHWHSVATLVFVPLVAWLGYTGRRRAHNYLVMFYIYYFIIFAALLTFLEERVIGQLMIGL